MSENKKEKICKTVGEVSLELKQESDTYEAEEISEAVHQGTNSARDWEENILEATQRGKSLYEGDFYVVILTKKERLLDNVMRRYFFPRESCPTPEYDQTVFKYHTKRDRLEYLWTVPDIHSCRELVTYREYLSEELQPLLQMVLDYKSGHLDQLAAKENGEFFPKK